MSDMRLRSILVAPAVAGSLTAMLLLPGCSAVSSFETELEDLSSNNTTFKLPSNIGNDMVWDELLIVCPYAEQNESVHPVLAEAASEVDTDSSDEMQWLLFRTNDDVRTLELSRINFDFCSRSISAEETFKPDARWEMSEDDGTFLTVPAV